MTLIRQSSPYPVIAAVCGLAWAGALVLQHIFGMEPCSLCILQRWALTGVLMGAVLARSLEARRPRPWHAVFVMLPTLAGLVVAVKHLWLQLAPHAESAGCGFGGQALLDNLPLPRALAGLFAGSGDCAGLPPVMGLPLPAWTTMLFLAILAGSSPMLLRKTTST